jgi:hypothetical protein
MNPVSDETNISKRTSQVWWSTPVIPALGKLRQEDLEFQGIL